MRTHFAAALAAGLALSAFAPAARGQKALVYCPVGIDSIGCGRIVAALQSKFPDGVDRGYDGSSGTLDLKAIDLNHYSVFVVPSLADDETNKPYAVLRAVASRLHLAINGHVAVYSGAPDQGSANRADKDAIIQNLATWAAGGHTRATSLVGMVALLDLSENASDRYAWVRTVSLADVSADAELQSFADVTPISKRNGDPLLAGGAARRFANMASYGLHIGARAAARTEIGAIGGGTAESDGQSVLVLYSNADGGAGGTKTGAALNRTSSSGASLDAASGGVSGPTLTTDKPDYSPGDTVLFTGTGWAPGDTVTITIHEDPQWSNPDRTVSAVADGSGNLSNHSLVIDPRDYLTTLTATAVGNPSGLVAQTTFTDGNASSVSGTVTDASNNAPLAGVTVSCTTTSGCNANVTTTTDASGSYAFSGGNKLSFAGNGPATLLLSFSKTGYLTGSLTIHLTTNGQSFSNENIALTPAGPTKLAFPNTVVTGVVNQCLTINIQTQNAGGTPTNVTSNTTVNLSTDNGSTGAGAFYTSAACSTPTTTVQINSGSSAGTLFYEATGRGSGSHKLTVSDNANVLTSANQTETINKADQSITFGPLANKTFGDPDFTVGATASSGLTVTFTVGATDQCTIAGTTVHLTGAGSCTVKADQAGNNNYNAAPQVPQTFTIAKANQTITFTPLANKTYGDPDFTVSATAGSGLTVTFTVGVTDQCTISGTTVHLTGAGSCTVKADQAGNNNYNPAPQVPQTFTIAKKTLTVATLSANNKTYDGNNTATLIGGTLAGVVVGDEANVSLDISTAMATFSDAFAGVNKLVTATGLGLSGAAKGDYILSPTTATTHANIDQKPLTASITATGKEYDGTTAVTGAVNCSVATKVGTDDVSCTASGAVFDSPNAGSRTVTANVALSGAAKDNYTLGLQTTASTSATITQKALTIKADDKEKTYDATPFSPFTVSYTGLIAADGGSQPNAGVLSTPVTFGGNAVGAVDAGSYTIIPSGATATNYAISFGNGTLKIDKANATINAAGFSGPYDGQPHPGSCSATGVNNVNVPTTSTYTPGPAVPVNAGSYTLMCAVSGQTNYNDASVNKYITITKVALTVTADYKSKTYDGNTFSPFTNTVAGFVNGEGTGVVSGAVTYTGSATTAVNAGAYVITPVVTGLSATNYTFTPVNGSLVIKQRPASVTPNPASKAYGDPDPSPLTTGTLTNFLAADGVTASYSRAPGGDAPTTNTSSPVAYTISATLTATGLLSNYAITYNTAAFTITNDTPVITSLTGPPGPVALGSPVTVSGAFADHGFAGDTYVVSSTWMNGATPLSVPNVGAASYNGNSGSFSITAPSTITTGVYTVTVTVTDRWQAASAPVQVTGYVVVYDPNGGFVTGGGWINSPAGAYSGDPTLTGKATFGFVSKYLKGQSTPDGNTEFDFHDASLNFTSTSYEWLVLAGNKAQFKGSGSINGSGDYGFMLTAIDGGLKSNGSPDTFRIKIWNKTTGAPIYDNLLGASDSADPTTTLGGGSIQIHQ